MKSFMPLTAALVATLALTGSGCSFNQPEETPVQPQEQESMMEQENDTTMEQDESTQAMVAGTHSINLETSRLEWAAEKVTGNGHFGTLAMKSGSITLNQEGQIEGGTFIFDMNSIDSEDQEGKAKEGLENHLKSDDFFDVENHPEGMFTITSVETSDNGIVVNGDLTLKGITNPISFPATLKTQDSTVLSTAEITIDRTLWDIRFGSGKFFENLGDNMIRDEIEISLTVEANQN